MPDWPCHRTAAHTACTRWVRTGSVSCLAIGDRSSYRRESVGYPGLGAPHRLWPRSTGVIAAAWVFAAGSAGPHEPGAPEGDDHLMGVILLVLILALLLGSLGFVVHVLWWIALAVLVMSSDAGP